MGVLMGFKIALVVIPFVTIPSIIYSISYFVLLIILLPIGFLSSLFKGRLSYRKASVKADTISVKLTPIFLIFAVPIILYLYVWQLLGWIFFGWMIIYFFLRKYSGVSQKHEQLTEAYRRFDSLIDNMNDRTK